MTAYPFREVEAKWQDYWERRQTFRVAEDIDRTRPKYYVLDMFPYPSSDGLHVGHPEGYTASDIVARYKRMRGFNVLHPIGWTPSGLPAEQYALRTGAHPRTTTERNVASFRRQLKALGFSYDWSREINTTTPVITSGPSGSSSSSSTAGWLISRNNPSGGARNWAPPWPTRKSSTAIRRWATSPASAVRSASGCCASRNTRSVAQRAG